MISVLSATFFPFLGYIITETIFVLMAIDTDLTNRNRTFTAFLVGLIIISMIALIQKLFYTRAAENLTYNLRIKMFDSMIYRQLKD